jgi:acyl-CoA thioesterase-1
MLCFTAVQADDSDPTILVLGDSLSAGFGLDLKDAWVTLLQTRLEEKGYGYRVVNASLSGDTTSNGLRRLPRALRIHQPEIVLIELGGNDGLRGYPAEAMQTNLDTMIVTANDAGAQVILAGMLIPPNYGEDYTAAFAQVYADLAAKHGVALIPFFMKNVALDENLMQADGIHPNKQAQPMLVDNVWPVLHEMLTQSDSD